MKLDVRDIEKYETLETKEKIKKKNKDNNKKPVSKVPTQVEGSGE